MPDARQAVPPSPAAGVAADLERRLAQLQGRLDEAEQTIEAIRNGDVDAVVVGSPNGQLVYTLENADRPYRVLIEQMQEGAITLSEDGTVLYCNQRFATLIGRRREAILGCAIAGFLSDHESAHFHRLLMAPAGTVKAGEFALRSDPGPTVPVNVSLVDLSIADELPRVICGVVTDLSQNRRRSEELAAANQRLAAEIDERRRVEDSLRLALAAADMGSWEVDLVDDRTDHSLRHDQIFGYAEPVARWSREEAFRHFVPEDRAAVTAAFDAAERTGSVDFVGRIRRADDESIRWIHVRGRVYYGAGRPLRIAGVVSDVTDQRAVEEQLRQAQKMEAVGQLTGGIAHDFNNLLLVIGGSLDMLARRLTPDERTARLLDAARSGVARGAKLNHQLLAFSRRQDLQAEVFRVDELLPGFGPLLERAVGEAVEVVIQPAPPVWPCRTDPHQLETAILNLAINARDAMPDGGTLTLTTENRVIGEQAALRAGAVPGEYVVIAVRDTGGGMTPEVIRRAFEPFFTTKEIGKGTGLGLSQVYGFAKQSEGFVTIDSEPGRGTAIRIHLPRTREVRVDGVVQRPESAAMAPGRGVVLLVEDDADVRATAAALLQDLGYAVREASTARAAIALLDSGMPIDLVFSDVIMPAGMSGIELARELAGREKPPRVLLTSGYTAQRVVPEELAGHLRVLRKPYTQADLSQAIHETLNA